MDRYIGVPCLVVQLVQFGAGVSKLIITSHENEITSERNRKT